MLIFCTTFNLGVIALGRRVEIVVHLKEDSVMYLSQLISLLLAYNNV